MLAIQIYRFLIGTKIHFSKFPEIVKTYMNQQSLHYDRFLYYFDNYSDRDGLGKIIKDCPHIGPIRSHPVNSGEHYYLSNIEEDTGCPETEIVSVVPKIHLRYGICESHLIYQDVDFFSQNAPAIIQSPGNTPSCIKGSSITLYRDAVFPRWTSIDLRIVTHNGTQTFDPTPYFEAMKQLLPGVRYLGGVECCLTGDEQAMYDTLNRDAAPLIANARNYLNKLIPDQDAPDGCGSNVTNLSVAPVLKMLCKQYGFTYVKYEYGVFFVVRRTKNGHYILLDVDVGLSFKGVNVSVNYSGAGFAHSIGHASCYPKDQTDLEDYLIQVFQALESAESDVFPALDSHYPPTPDWFVPIV